MEASVVISKLQNAMSEFTKSLIKMSFIPDPLEKPLINPNFADQFPVTLVKGLIHEPF